MSWLGRWLCRCGWHDGETIGWMPWVGKMRCRRCGAEWLQGG
jgi:hypothetical protein